MSFDFLTWLAFRFGVGLALLAFGFWLGRAPGFVLAWLLLFFAFGLDVIFDSVIGTAFGFRFFVFGLAWLSNLFWFDFWLFEFDLVFGLVLAWRLAFGCRSGLAFNLVLAFWL